MPSRRALLAGLAGIVGVATAPERGLTRRRRKHRCDRACRAQKAEQRFRACQMGARTACHCHDPNVPTDSCDFCVGQVLGCCPSAWTSWAAYNACIA